MVAYYNEIEPYAAEWLRNLIAAGHIAAGDVDTRSIVDVRPDDLRGYAQCHFFAGIGGWSLAARLAGWPDYRPLWTGSCPCQPFSVAGKQAGTEDERHLWPEQFRLIRARRPDVWMGEQVAAAVGKHWLDGVRSDLESIGYACGASVVPACAVDAPHRRDRLWIVADSNGVPGGQGYPVAGRGEDGIGAREIAGFGGSCDGDVADADGERSKPREQAAAPARYGHTVIAAGGSRHVADADQPGSQGRGVLRQRGDERSAWSDGVEWAIGADGKARRVEPSIRLLAHGVPARVGKLRAYGNAIVPQVAAEVIGAFMDVRP